MKFTIVLQKDEDGFITASVPGLPGCHSQGLTREEARANIADAIQGYIASKRKHGEPIPKAELEELEVAA
jgi:predicted RNase H-like HicB family nuclease